MTTCEECFSTSTRGRFVADFIPVPAITVIVVNFAPRQNFVVIPAREMITRFFPIQMSPTSRHTHGGLVPAGGHGWEIS